MVLHSSTGRAWHRLRQGGGSDRGAGARFPAEPPMQKKKTQKKKRMHAWYGEERGMKSARQKVQENKRGEETGGEAARCL